LTLEEALEGEVAVVHETGDVNRLALENRSETESLFVQAGDIVKGGKQDRVLSVDMIVPPKSGRVPIDSFCVEQGRWSRRGGENVRAFGSANEVLAHKGLKVAAKHKKRQGEVWGEVEKLQGKLNRAIGKTVKSRRSQSSLQLTLEDGNVGVAVKDYLKHLSPITDGQEDVIGFAFAVNGEVNCAELYASNKLFRKLWNKLLKASAVEAVSEQKGAGKTTHPSVEDVKSWFEAAENGKIADAKDAGRARMETRESEKDLLFETKDARKKGLWIHRNYIRKSEERSRGGRRGTQETDSNEDFEPNDNNEDDNEYGR
ncbi:MAG: ARPP-1 family domain-containing protein, partial [Planctomycetota bacterium]